VDRITQLEKKAGKDDGKVSVTVSGSANRSPSGAMARNINLLRQRSNDPLSGRGNLGTYPKCARVGLQQRAQHKLLRATRGG
jgi:hypothetical protein